MKLNYEDDYTLKTVFDLALHYGENVHIADIARRQDIPGKFLEQLLLKLKKAGIVASKKGPNGGYYLAKKPKDINLKQVLESIKGPFAPIECAWNKDYIKKCPYFVDCVFKDIFTDIYKDVSKKLKAIDLNKLIMMHKKKQKLKGLKSE
ncbi:MAG: Rrf2 family transcriptional regulator [Candidatus Aureabacteria bacterium]|nr:Rrf2 family transcriptional regulator [Candidatus Auribacterota bacterium]